MVSAIVFISLRSADYLAVDGAIRALEVYRDPHPFFHGNNHLLYPIDLLEWTCLLQALGISPRDPFQFIADAQAMNAVAAAGCLAMFYLFCCAATSAPVLSLCATAGYGLSNAFLLHATNSAEPMVGLLWSLVAAGAVCASLKYNRNFLAVAGGFLVMLAMATYQSMVLGGPGLLVLLSFWPEFRSSGVAWRARCRRILAFLAGCTVGLAVVYSSAYYFSGTQTFSQMAARFLRLEGGQEVYGGWRAAKIVNLPVGFAVSLAPVIPSDYTGLRSLLLPRYLHWITLTTAATLVGGTWLIALFFQVVKNWRMINEPSRVALFTCATVLVGDVFALAYWEPLYEKLWLQPLAAIFLIGAIVLATPRFKAIRFLRPVALAVLALMGVTNVAFAIRNHLLPTPFLQEARKVAAVIRPGDLLVGEWDNVSLLYESFLAREVNIFSVPAEAEIDGLASLTRLNPMIAQTQRLDRQVYFLAVLDTPEAAWNAFLGDRCGLPYHSFDPYRKCTEVVEELRLPDSTVTLRRLLGSKSCRRLAGLT